MRTNERIYVLCVHTWGRRSLLFISEIKSVTWIIYAFPRSTYLLWVQWRFTYESFFPLFLKNALFLPFLITGIDLRAFGLSQIRLLIYLKGSSFHVKWIGYSSCASYITIERGWAAVHSALRTVVLRAIAVGHAGVILSLASSFPATSTLVPLKASALHRWKLWDTAAQPAPLPRASPSVHRLRGGRVAADTFETSVLLVLLEREPLPDSVPTAQVIRASALRILACVDEKLASLHWAQEQNLDNEWRYLYFLKMGIYFSS